MQSLIRPKPAENLIHKLFKFSFLAGIILSLSVIGCSDNSTSPNQGDLFDSGNISPGETFTYTFKQTQTVEYFCRIHEPDMRGTITVEENTDVPDTITITMENTQFHPQDKTVAPNATVRWVNNDNFDHTVVSGSPGGQR
jgi:plastocyanin